MSKPLMPKHRHVMSAMGNAVWQANSSDINTLFKPSAGHPPPALAGRDRWLGCIAQVLERPLASGQPPTNAVLIHGARGTGKTCLMNEALRNLSPRIKVAHLDADDFLDAGRLAQTIINQATEGRSIPKRTLHFSLGAAVAGTGMQLSIGKGDGAASRNIVSLADAIRFCAIGVHEDGDSMEGAPLLLAVDEVHAVQGQGRESVLRSLLNCIQRSGAAGAQMPVGLIMAGTPDAYGHLRSCGTFVERMIGVAPVRKSNIPLGCLDQSATHQAISEPLSQHDVKVERGVLEAAWQATMGYPYFIQEFGACLCESLLEHAPESQVIDSSLAAAALPGFEGLKRQRYEERRKELEAAGSLEAALLVAQEIFAEGHLTSAKLKSLCNEGVEARDEAIWHAKTRRTEWARYGEDAEAALLHTGLIWGQNGSESAHYEFGIPSFAKHTVEYAASSDMKHLRSIAQSITVPDHAPEVEASSLGRSP